MRLATETVLWSTRLPRLKSILTLRAACVGFLLCIIVIRAKTGLEFIGLL